jgi:phosphate-selective porin OprO/OprP
MQLKKTVLASLLIASGIISTPTTVLANDSEELENLRKLVQELDQRIRVIDRKSELAEESDAATKKAAPKVVAGEKGFGIESADGKFKFKLSGLLQADHRLAIDDDELQSNDGYLLRRVRPTFSGTLFDIYDFRFTPDFAPQAANVQDAFINARFQPWLAVQAGKFKTPVSLERLQSGSNLRFTERSYVANSLLPNRDIGVQIHGNVLDSKLNYAFGSFNGVADGGSSSTNSDNNVDREWAGRLFAEPFKGADNLLSGLGIGIAGTVSDYSGSALQSHNYRSPGQNSIYTYNAAVQGDGDQHRISPQFYYYAGPFGVIGEYARVSHDVARGARSDKLSHDAWNLAGTYILTGEDNSYGSVSPKQNFEWGKDGWGAWEIGLRYSELNIDEDAFEGTVGTRYASATSSTEKAQSWAGSLNWYLNKHVKLQTTYEQTTFDGAFAAVDDREDEKILFTRFQVAY